MNYNEAVEQLLAAQQELMKDYNRFGRVYLADWEDYLSDKGLTLGFEPYLDPYSGTLEEKWDREGEVAIYMPNTGYYMIAKKS